jgi:hypothetical protein
MKSTNHGPPHYAVFYPNVTPSVLDQNIIFFSIFGLGKWFEFNNSILPPPPFLAALNCVTCRVVRNGINFGVGWYIPQKWRGGYSFSPFFGETLFIYCVQQTLL